VKNRNIVLQQQRMVERVHLAVNARVDRFQRLRLPRLGEGDAVRVNEKVSCEKLVVTLSGVGGYLEMVSTLTSMPPTTRAGVLSLQSIPPQFAPTLAEYLNARAPLDVRVLVPGAPMSPGRCYIGTTGQRMDIQPRWNRWVVQPLTGPEEVGEASTVDRLLSRAAEIYQSRTVVFLLSGGPVGSLAGLRAVLAAGGCVLAPKMERAILPATMVPAVENQLITEMYDPKDVVHVLARYCA
jgi:two-component system chemotaxis response regulator CheB